MYVVRCEAVQSITTDSETTRSADRTIISSIALYCAAMSCIAQKWTVSRSFCLWCAVYLNHTVQNRTEQCRAGRGTEKHSLRQNILNNSTAVSGKTFSIKVQQSVESIRQVQVNAILFTILLECLLECLLLLSTCS
jgi:hypothetical protein